MRDKRNLITPDAVGITRDCPAAFRSGADDELIKVDEQIAELERKLNAKQIRFAHGVASGLTGTEAARQAGYDSSRPASTASRLRNDRDVQALIAGYLARAQMRASISPERISAALWYSYNRCMELDQPGPAARFLELLMRQHKLLDSGSRAGAGVQIVQVNTGLPAREVEVVIDGQAVEVEPSGAVLCKDSPDSCTESGSEEGESQ